MILTTKEEIHQWLKEQCPVYVRWLGDDLDGLIDYVLKRRIGVSDLTYCLNKERKGTLVDLTHLSHGRTMIGQSLPFHGVVNLKYWRGRVDRPEYVIYFRNQKDEEETVCFREEDGKEDFEKTVAFYLAPTTLDTSFYERKMNKEKECEIRQRFKKIYGSDKKQPPKKRNGIAAASAFDASIR